VAMMLLRYLLVRLLLLLTVPLLFLFKAAAPPEIYTLSLHDALPISSKLGDGAGLDTSGGGVDRDRRADPARRAAGAEGITPAYAGSTCSSPPASWPSADHPRIRGEHASRSLAMSAGLGSSPRARGAHPVRGRRRLV